MVSACSQPFTGHVGDAKTKVSPPSAYCNIETTQKEEEEEEEEVVDNEFLDPTWCEGREMHCIRERMQDKEDVAEQHPPGTGSRVNKSKRAQLPSASSCIRPPLGLVTGLLSPGPSLKPHMTIKPWSSARFVLST